MSDPKSALDWAHREGVAGNVLAELAVLSRRRIRRRIVAASTLAVLVLLAGGIFHRRQGVADQIALHPPSGTTLIAGPTRQVLPDGTVVEWKDEAVHSVEFTPAVRRIVLRQGTAYYQVVKDASRPFVVEVEGLEVRAVGTAFTVQIEPTGVEVLVAEGKVAVADKRESAAPPSPRPDALVTAGEHIKVDTTILPAARPSFTVVRLSTAELKQSLTWRIPRLAFSGTRLVEAVAKFNQYNQRRLVLADRSLENLQISGILRADNLTALLSLLHADFGIEAEPHGEDKILLRRSR